MTTAELAERAGTTKRTIRYYLAEGLLPPAMGTSARLEFDREHELRLRLIQHLQAAGIKLGAVKGLLSRYSLEDVEGLVEAFDRGEHPTLGDQAHESPPPGMVRQGPLSLLYGTVPNRSSSRETASPSAAASPFTGTPPSGEAAHFWRRIRLADDVEMMVRAPLAPGLTEAVEEVVAYGMERLAPERLALDRPGPAEPAPRPTLPGGAAGQTPNPTADEEAP